MSETPPSTNEFILNEDVSSDSTEPKPMRCIDFIWRWRKCTSAGNHFRHYYIYGEFPLCEFEKECIKRCFSHKFKDHDEDKQYLLKAEQQIKDKEENFTDKPSRHVWEFRENPAADWAKKNNTENAAV